MNKSHVIAPILILFIRIKLSLAIFWFNPESDVFFVLRIQNRDFNDEEVLTLDTKEELINSSFDPSKQILFHIHGYMEDRKVLRHVSIDE